MRLGATSFGGPAAHIALMEEEVVRRRQWLTPEEFLDLLGATNLIPGPNSTEMAIHIGYRRAGWAGLLVAGICFIVPAAAITLALAWFYVRYGTIPRVHGLLYGIKPVMISVVLQALWRLGRSAVKSRSLALLGVLALTAAAAGAEELVVLFGTGLVAALWLARPASPTSAEAKAAPPPPLAMLGLAGGASAGAGTVSSSALFLVFAKIGSVLFGSGYVLLAFLRADLVEQHHWLSESQLVDAIAVGQVTPGPVFTTATFIGFVLGGGGGAAAATLGIFLPAFVFVALSGLFVPKLRSSRRASAFLDGLNVASLALMAVVTGQLARAVLLVDHGIDLVAVAIALVAGGLLVRWRVSSAWLILAGAAVGLATVSWR